MSLRSSFLALSALSLMLLGVSSAANAAVETTLSFYRITNNGNTNVASQLSVEVISLADPNQVAFKFYNSAVTSSSITDVYFDDGSLLGIASISDSGSSVAFTAPATPGDLPGGNAIYFETTKGFSADSDSPVLANGINAATEWVQITFNLITGQTVSDVLAALDVSGITNPTSSSSFDGKLRIGLHVQGIGATDGSDSYVNNSYDNSGNQGEGAVPEPASLAIWGLGMGLVALTGNRFRRRKVA